MATEIGLYEAKTHFSAIADRVARGESFTITRRGETIGHFIPARQGPDQAEIRQTLEAVRRSRQKCKPVTTQEIIAWKAEGRE